MTEGVSTDRIQYLAIVGSIFILVLVFELIRTKKLKEEYSLLWFFWGLIFLLLSFWRDALHVISWQLGIHYPPAAFFLIFLVAIFFILVHYSLVLSKLTDMNRTLVQELAILKFELDEIRSKKDMETA